MSIPGEIRSIKANRPLPLIPNPRPRANSISNDLDSTNETIDIDENKIDFAQSKKRFENQPLMGFTTKDKRPSMPNPVLSSLRSPPPVPPKPTNFVRRTPVNSMSTEISENIRSVSPTTSVLKMFAERFSIPRESLSETPSPTPPIETDEKKSVAEIRDFFDKEKTLTPGVAVHGRDEIRKKIKIPSLDIPEPPTRPPPVPPSPFVLSQLPDVVLETSDSAAGDSSQSSNPIFSRQSSSDSSFTDEEERPSNEKKTKLRRVLEEVLATEKTFVGILYGLSVKLSAEVKIVCEKEENLIVLFNNTYRQLLGSIQAIYGLHHKTILPEFEKFISTNDSGNMWTIIEKNFKFIEIIYKDYYVKYYSSQTKLDEICRENPLLNEAMMKCQPYLCNLYPLTQLNCANQRLLRYILCMETCMKYIDENTDEYRQTRSIHDELDRIAKRCEEELVVSPAQLNDLNERLENRFECFKSQRKLLWHGSLKKQSPRKRNDLVQRYMILFSDCILVCSEDFGKKLEIRRELSMKDLSLDVLEGGKTWTLTNNDSTNAPIVYYPFRVNAVEKSYEFVTEKPVDRDMWIKKIRQASEDFNKKTTNIEIRQSFSQTEDRQQLGKRAPIWVNDNDVSRCQICNNRFRNGILSSRRHHCRCCGRCICGSCSSKRLTLEYCSSEGDVRICDTCYTHFSGIFLQKNYASWPQSTRDVDKTILFGDFRPINSNNSVWIALQEDHSLHIYSARLDLAEDYSIKIPEVLEINFENENRTFYLNESTKKHTFILDNNHQITFNKNEQTDERMKCFESKIHFYADLWLDAIRAAHIRTLPIWYLRKRDSADSGVNVG